MTVDDCLDRWLERLRQAHNEREKPQLTAKREREIKPVRAMFGPLRPDEVTYTLCEQYAERRRKAGVTARTASIELAALRAALKAALKREEIPHAPFVPIPQGVAKPRLRTLRRAELARFLAALEHRDTPLHLKLFARLALVTGVRSGHILGLRWEHIDWEEGVIWFTRANPNAAANKRVEDKSLTPRLEVWLRDAHRYARTPFVIEWRDAPVASLKTAWRKLLERAELKDVRIHDLRRTAGTLGLRAGARNDQVAALLSDDERTTRRHYAHADPAMTREIMMLIEGSIEDAT